MTNKGGRPLKLTSDVKEALFSGLRKGLTLKAACKCAGISYSTLANWRQKNRNQLKQGNTEKLYEFVAIIDAIFEEQQHEHRLAAINTLKPRDYRYGWKNPMPDETKQKLRVQAFEKAIENIRRRNKSW